MRDLDDAAYVPGNWVAISAASGCLLVDLVAADPIVRRCWKLLSEDAGADAVLDALAAGGISAAPPFALVVRTEAGHRAVVRHPASLTVHSEGRDQIDVDSLSGTSWTDTVLVDAPLDAVTMTGARTDASVELPMGAGVTMASVVHLRPGAPAESLAARPVPFPRDAAPMHVPAPLQPVRAVPSAISDAANDVPPVELSNDVADGVPVEDGGSYDHLFGASVQRPMSQPEPAPVRASPAPPVAAVDPVDFEGLASPVTGDTAGWQTAVPAVTEATPSAHAGPEALIEGVPWARSDSSDQSPAAHTPAVVEAAPDGETTTVPSTQGESSDYGATVNRAQLRAAAQAAAGPTVLAGRCPNGHLSPPHADRCRVCRAPMPEQEAFEIGRPVLGVLRLPSGDLVTLDRGVLLGRSPDVPNGLDRPHVLRLKSPDNDISRNHAEVVIDGWNVSVRDLGSTNGTVVQLPGRAPLRLRENEPALIENGATVTLADEVTLVFEVQA